MCICGCMWVYQAVVTNASDLVVLEPPEGMGDRGAKALARYFVCETEPFCQWDWLCSVCVMNMMSVLHVSISTIVDQLSKQP